MSSVGCSLFVDDEFPADKSSLTFVYSGEDKYDHMVFRRPKELSDHPQLYGHGGMCHVPLPMRPWKDHTWFRLCLAVMSLNSRYMERLIPGYHQFSQNFGAAYTGKFHFRFWIFGEEQEVEIDDRLPVIDTGLAFCPEIGDPPEYWCALVEKAYAKCHLAYEAIEMGNPINALTDLTGDVCQRIDLSQHPREPAFQAFSIAHTNNSFLVTWRHKDSFIDRELSSVWQESNLLRSLQQLPAIQSRSYVPDLRLFVVTAVTKFTMKGGHREPMIRLLDPSVEESTWSGNYSFSDTRSWSRVSKIYLDSFHPKKSLEMNEFWISYEDFCRHFRDVIICSSPHGNDVSMTSQERIYNTSLVVRESFDEEEEMTSSSATGFHGGWLNPNNDSFNGVHRMRLNHQTWKNSPRSSIRSTKLQSQIHKQLSKQLSSDYHKLSYQLSNSQNDQTSAHALQRQRSSRDRSDFRRFPEIQISKVESLKSTNREFSFRRNPSNKGSGSAATASYLRTSLASTLNMRNRSFRGAAGETGKRTSAFSSSCSSSVGRSTSSMLSRVTRNTTLTDSTCSRSRSQFSGRSELSSRNSYEPSVCASRRNSLPDSTVQAQLVECMSITSIFEKKTDLYRPVGQWKQLMHTTGSWTKDTSGGPPKSKLHGSNPRFTFHVSRPEHAISLLPPHQDDGKIHVLIALMRDYRSALVKCRSNSGKTTFGFTLYKCKKEEKDQRKKLSKLKYLDDTLSDPETREIATLCALESGHYMIVPYTAEVGQSGHFLLRVLSDSDPVKNTVGCVLS